MDAPRVTCRLRLTNRILAGLFAAFAFWAVLFPLTNTDIWWHLAAGRHMVEQGGFIHEDPFSYAPEGAEWTDVHWLFQLSAYLVHSAAGVGGLVLAKALLFTGACLLVLLVAWREETVPVAVALLAAAAYFTRYLVLVRPIVFSLIFLAAFLLVLERFRRGGRARLLWILPGLQVLWANTQGLFILGPLTVLCYLAGDAAALFLRRSGSRSVGFESPLDASRLRTLLYFLLGTCAACLVTPYGPRGLALPFVLFSRLFSKVGTALPDVYSLGVAENVPSWMILQESPERLAHVVWFGLIALGSFVAARRRLCLPRLLLSGAFLYLALIAKRNVVLFLLVIVPVTVANLNAALDELRPRVAAAAAGRWSCALARFPLAASAAALLLMGILCVGLVRSSARDPSTPRRPDNFVDPTGPRRPDNFVDPTGLGLAPFRYPVRAAGILEREDFEGNVFNSVRYGGYLIWRLHPRKKVFIDGRLVIRSREAFRDYLRLLDEPERFYALEERYGITRAVLPTAGFRRHLGLVRTLYRDRRWRLVYADGACALFELDSSAEAIDLSSPSRVAAIVAGLEERFGDNEHVLAAARENLAVLLLHLGILGRAEEVLEGTESAGSRRYLARCYYMQGRPDEARELAASLLEENPRDTNNLNLLGQLHLDRGEPVRALEFFRRAIRIDPYNRYAEEAVRRLEAEERADGR